MSKTDRMNIDEFQEYRRKRQRIEAERLAPRIAASDELMANLEHLGGFLDYWQETLSDLQIDLEAERDTEEQKGVLKNHTLAKARKLERFIEEGGPCEQFQDKILNLLYALRGKDRDSDL